MRNKEQAGEFIKTKTEIWFDYNMQLLQVVHIAVPVTPNSLTNTKHALQQPVSRMWGQYYGTFVVLFFFFFLNHEVSKGKWRVHLLQYLTHAYLWWSFKFLAGTFWPQTLSVPLFSCLPSPKHERKPLRNHWLGSPIGSHKPNWASRRPADNKNSLPTVMRLIQPLSLKGKESIFQGTYFSSKSVTISHIKHIKISGLGLIILSLAVNDISYLGKIMKIATYIMIVHQYILLENS